MSDDEKKVDASASTDDPAMANYYPTKKRGRKGLIVLIVLLVVGIGAGSGFWIWHEQPSFCSAFCHVPMDPYLATYSAESGLPTVDKWGNDMELADSMLAVTHREAGEDCLACHVPTIGEMVSEGLHWVAGSYYNPLQERNLDDVTAARKLPNDEFCLNSGCHHYDADGNVITSREDLKLLTSNELRNPHSDPHSKMECSDCHKAHRASVNPCTDCHSTDAPLPDGWLTADEEKLLETMYTK